MDKQNVGQPSNGLLLTLKKQGHSDTGYNTDETGGYYAKCNKPVTKRQILHDSTYMRSLEESNS